MTEETIEKKSNKGFIAGGVVILFLLLAAAFVGGKLFAQDTTAMAGPADTQPIVKEIGELAQMVELPQMESAAEQPARAPEAKGLFIGRTDDTLTLGTGNIIAMISTEPDAVPEFSYDGIEIDVVMTNQTKLFADVTEYTLGQTAVEQKLEKLENLDDLQENAFMNVWGQRDGNRIVAETIIIESQSK